MPISSSFSSNNNSSSPNNGMEGKGCEFKIHRMCVTYQSKKGERLRARHDLVYHQYMMNESLVGWPFQLIICMLVHCWTCEYLWMLRRHLFYFLLLPFFPPKCEHVKSSLSLIIKSLINILLSNLFFLLLLLSGYT